MEAALKAGKCKYIGVSNYPAALLEEMVEYAEIMPCVNQLELHPRYASPDLQATAKKHGVVLTGYGTGNSLGIYTDPVRTDCWRGHICICMCVCARARVYACMVLKKTIVHGRCYW